MDIILRHGPLLFSLLVFCPQSLVFVVLNEKALKLCIGWISCIAFALLVIPQPYCLLLLEGSLFWMQRIIFGLTLKPILCKNAQFFWGEIAEVLFHDFVVQIFTKGVFLVHFVEVNHGDVVLHHDPLLFLYWFSLYQIL